MKKLGLIAGILLVLASCNKEQRAANKLEGTWNVTNEIWTNSDGSYDEIVEAEKTQTLTFGACKVKEDETCTVKQVITNAFGGGEIVENNLEYILNDDGTMMTWEPTSEFPLAWTVESLSSREAVLKRTNTSGEYTIEVRMEKID